MVFRLEDFCDDILVSILLYCDFPSAIRFATSTNETFRKRILNKAPQQRIFDEIFRRHGFAPIQTTQEEIVFHGCCFSCSCSYCDDGRMTKDLLLYHSIVASTWHRRMLRKALLQPTLSKQQKQRQRCSSSLHRTSASGRCFSIPNRCFTFYPFTTLFRQQQQQQQIAAGNSIVVPINLDNDPPPVDLHVCGDFQLTSTACSSDLLYLDPFVGSLSILTLEHVQSHGTVMISEEEQMARRLLLFKPTTETTRTTRRDRLTSTLQHQQQQQQTSIQCLYSPPTNHVAFNALPYFPQVWHKRNRLQLRDVDMSHLGVDSKPILQIPQSYQTNNYDITGTMVGLCQILSMEEPQVEQEQGGGRLAAVQEWTCTNAMVWFRTNSDGEYGTPKCCRVPWMFHYMDMDPIHSYLYVSFPPGNGPFRRTHVAAATSTTNNRENTTWQWNDREDSTINPESTSNDTSVVVYPLVPWNKQHDDNTSFDTYKEYFPDPIAILSCHYPVTSFAVDPTGSQLYVATNQGTIEVWLLDEPNTNNDHERYRTTCNSYQNPRFKRVAIINVQESIHDAMDRIVAMELQRLSATTTTTTTKCSLPESSSSSSSSSRHNQDVPPVRQRRIESNFHVKHDVNNCDQVHEADQSDTTTGPKIVNELQHVLESNSKRADYHVHVKNDVNCRIEKEESRCTDNKKASKDDQNVFTTAHACHNQKQRRTDFSSFNVNDSNDQVEEEQFQNDTARANILQGNETQNHIERVNQFESQGEPTDSYLHVNNDVNCPIQQRTNPIIVIPEERLELIDVHGIISSFHFPRHVPIHTFGYVTLHHSRDSGSTLLLWKTNQSSTCHDQNGTKAAFDVVSMIRLPLVPRRKPIVHYDGSRLVVFGEDHIGLIVLVYHVWNTNMEQVVPFQGHRPTSPASNHPQPASAILVEGSGGVINLTCHPDPAPIVFANRVRHVALGGIGPMDAIQMTCNERFLILTTKTGNLLGEFIGTQAPLPSSSSYSEGLLVIDLQDKKQFKQLV